MTRNDLSRLNRIEDTLYEVRDYLARMDERMKALPAAAELNALLNSYPDTKSKADNHERWKYYLLGGAAAAGAGGNMGWDFLKGLFKAMGNG